MNAPIHDQVVEGTHVTVEYDDEPVYEYRVVCADGRCKPRRFTEREDAKRAVDDTLRGWPEAHHTIERRSVGPWEAT